MRKVATKLQGVYIIEPDVFADHRGYFMESYSQKKWEELGFRCSFIQDNESLSVQEGVIRGLHYQLYPKAQTKLVRVLQGAVFDVVADIRKGSPTFAQWIGVVLSEQNKRQIIVPKGFAHGVCTLTSNTRLFYKVDEYYSPHDDRGIAWNDPRLAVSWPTNHPILSEKDRRQPQLADAEINFIYEKRGG